MDRAPIVAAARLLPPQDAETQSSCNEPLWLWNRCQLVLPIIGKHDGRTTDSGARILLPETIFNYGLDAFPILKKTRRCAIKTSPRTAPGY